MGCSCGSPRDGDSPGGDGGGGSGDGSPGDIDVKFSDTGCASMDAFFGTVQGVIDPFKEMSKALSEQKTAFFEATKFYEQPGAGKNSTSNFL